MLQTLLEKQATNNLISTMKFLFVLLPLIAVASAGIFSKKEVEEHEYEITTVMGEDDGSWKTTHGNMYMEIHSGGKIMGKTHRIDLVGQSSLGKPKNPRLEGHILTPGTDFQTKAFLPTDVDGLPTSFEVYFKNEVSHKQANHDKEDPIKIDFITVRSLDEDNKKTIKYCSDGRAIKLSPGGCPGAPYCRHVEFQEC